MSSPISASLPAQAPRKAVEWTPHRPPKLAPEGYVGKLFAGRYLLRRRIGGGGMSDIYEASDSTLGFRVVVKIMRGDLPSDPVDRFRREAHVLAGLKHEHLGAIIDRQDPEDGPRFFVADFIDGLDLSKLRRRGRVPAAVVLQIGLQVSAALAYVHAAGVLHRDVKPSNIMLARHPSGDVFARIIDFGIAKLMRGSDLASPDSAPAGARRETRGDAVAGTAPYWCGLEGPQRDVYALALTLAELLTGDDPDPAVNLARAFIPSALAHVISRALRSEIVTMDALHNALREADLQPPADASAERQRYVAGVFADDEPRAQDKAPPASDTPRFAGRYIVCGELGQGGMGRVQIVFDTLGRRRLALKTIHPKCAGMKSLEHRFHRECLALAAVVHAGVPIVYDIGTHPEPFFTMEIVEGATLSSVLRRGKLDPLRALGLAIDLADILRAAHDVGVVHRDVKPDNIVLAPGDRVRLLDFGACLLMPRFHQRHLLFPATPPEQRYATGELEAVGSPGYSAPEVLSTEGGTSPRSDIYSVSVLLYEMLTGRRYADPAEGRPRPIDPGEFPAALGSIADLLHRGTAHEPNDRVWSMSELIRDLEILRAALLRARHRRQIAAISFTTLASAAALALAVYLVAPSRVVTEPSQDRPSPVVAEPAAPSSTSPGVVPTRRDEPQGQLPPSRQPRDVAASPPDPQPTTDLENSSGAAAGTASSSPSSGRDPAAVALTKHSVRQRLTTRHARLSKCGTPLLVLDLTINAGRMSLAAVNGMGDGDPLHSCVRDGLRGLTFPGRPKTARFTVSLDLRPSQTREPP